VPNSERSSGRTFDRRYGVTTHAVLFLSDLDPDDVGDAGAHATHYEAVPPNDFRALMSHLPASAISSSTFVDIGAGMGRALLLAAEYPFRQVVGVELSAGLFEVARENLARANARQRKCNDVRVDRSDARLWEYPPGDLVVFLFNPFDAAALVATLGAIRTRRRCGETWVVYHTPVERAVLEAIEDWTLVTEIPCGIVGHLSGQALPSTSRSFCE
jgi:SAM-dependent methyltransferase